MELVTRIKVYFKRFLLFFVLIYCPYKANCFRMNDYVYMKSVYGLVDPYQLPSNKRIEDLDEIEDCDNCPRVYHPACAHNNITYVNVCILNCLNETLRRYGPCIIYRRNNDIILLDLAIPTAWRLKNVTEITTQ